MVISEKDALGVVVNPVNVALMPLIIKSIGF
jgi:hypothetical protein